MKKVKESYKQLMKGEKPDLALWAFPIIGLLILCLLPFLLTREKFSFLDYNTTGQIGDTIGGIAGPVIALIAAMLTFLAFWIQVQANKAQTKQFNKEDTDTKIDRFENKFYVLLKLHRENVTEINISDVVSGRKAFIFMFNEFKFAYYALKSIYSHENLYGVKREFSEQDFINISFIVLLMGIEESSVLGLSQYDDDLIEKYIRDLKCYQSDFRDGKTLSIFTDDGAIFTLKITYKPFCGHMSILGHYFRHLFQTVKFVVEQDDGIIKNKYEYLKTVRAQLSNHEQLLLYYNGLTSFGNSWIDNKYFTEYGIIKNIPLPLANFGIKPKEKFGERNKMGELFFEWDEIIEKLKSKKEDQFLTADLS